MVKRAVETYSWLVKECPTSRVFETGATRDNDELKNDYEGALSPLVIEEYGNYITKHCKQSDGQLRPSDNWQKGIPQEVYMKSMWRHFLDVWFIHRGHRRFDAKDGHEITLIEALSAVFFNVQGMFHEVLSLKKDSTFENF